MRDGLLDAEAGWSMGSFGVIAEFHQDAGEPLLVDAPDRLTRATARGAIRLDIQKLSAIKPIAYEALSPKPHRWSHALALCLQTAEAMRPARKVLTPLGLDSEAICEDDRGAMLFDMGLGLKQCDFCIRTSDPQLIRALNASAGRSLFDPQSSVMGAILSAHPHRVALTNIGRAEVYQKIGGPDTGGVSPAGPHTHVLPKLLRSGRTHSANAPIPDGLIPCGYLHPGNPVIDAMGKDRPFAPALHEAFQKVLQLFSPPDVFTAKRSAIDAIQRGEAPETFVPAVGRHARSGMRIAIRQLDHAARAAEDRELLSRVAAWRTAFDTASEPTPDTDEQSEHAPG